jgi:lysophospholipase L1-like esterase
MSRSIALLCLLVAACNGDADPPDSGRGDAAGMDGGGGDAAGLDGGGDDGGTRDGSASDTGADTGPAPTPGPYYVGRHDASDPLSVRMSWSGTGLVLRFRGTAARVTMNGTGRYFTVVVDGAVQPTLAVSGDSNTYDVATGLTDGEHLVELYRRTEGSYGATEIHGVEVDGELLGVPPPARRIEVVGDSITAGYGVDGPDQYCDFSAETENHFLTYAAVAARAVDAELAAVAWSGKGVVYNYGDDRTQPMPTLYDRVIATEAGSTGTIRPADVVVVNLGTNDFSTDGDPPESEFVPAYVGLLEQIRARHPAALIACTIGPPLGASDMDRARPMIESAIAMRAAAGDANVQWIDLDGFSDWGCDYHPGDETHALLAEDLVAFLRSELGW